MIIHNIKQSIRGMLKNKTFTFLNLAGFAVGFAVCIVIMIFAFREYSVDSFYPDNDRIYRLVDEQNNKVGIDKDVIVQLNNFTSIELAVPVFYANWATDEDPDILQDKATGNFIATKTFIASNNDFFKLFGLQVIIGNPQKPFADEKSMVLTRSLANKLFGTTDVINKIIKYEDALFTVSAVVEDMDECTSMSGKFFINHKNTDYELGVIVDKEGIRYNPRDIYILAKENIPPKEITKQLNENFPANKSKTKAIALQTLQSIYFSKPMEDDSNKKANVAIIWIFVSIALLTLAMSIFNYANFTISRQMTNLKQSGIKITNGAQRSQIRWFYLVDVSISVIAAFVMSLLIAYISIPYASKLLNVSLSLNWLLHTEMIIITACMLLVVIILSAIAPIGFISRLKIQTLFGKTNIKSKKHPVKIAMTISQIAISMVLLVSVIVVNKQLHYMKTTDLGFKTTHILRLKLPWEFKNYSMIKQEYSKLPFVESLSLSSHSPGTGWSRWGFEGKDGKKIMMNVITVDNDFLKTFDIKLLKGREFMESDLNKTMYFTEYAVKQIGWDNIDEIKLNRNKKVVGVINDIFYNSLHSKMTPVAINFADNYYGSLNLKLLPGSVSEQMAEIQKVWSKTMQDTPLSYNFYDQYFDSLYKKEERQGEALTIFVIIAFIITCMGLFGQVLQNTHNRIKEIGIRKINGATIKEVMILLNKEFLWTVAIAFAIATPLAYYAMNKWLENFAYKTTLSWWIFALAGLSALLIALFTVSWQSYRAASRNPVEALRYE